MNYSNFHTHSTWCDGRDTPEELVAEAVRLNCPEIGFSGHSPLPEDSGSMRREAVPEYCGEIVRLKQKYSAWIKIFLGIEQDFFSDPVPGPFDFVIGAVHYVEKEGILLAVDESRDAFVLAVREYYNGDYYAFAEDYYTLVAKVWSQTHCQIIAHFDLITKYNEEACLFDPLHPRYIRASDMALDCLLKTPAVLEVNSGAIARGYRTEPYPEARILKRWLDAGGRVILSSDCHDLRQLLCAFPEMESNLKEMGCRDEQLLRSLP